MTVSHKCSREFPTAKIDDCCGIGVNVCEGTEQMMLSLWYKGTDGTECYYDEAAETLVNYCPFCGLKNKGERK